MLLETSSHGSTDILRSSISSERARIPHRNDPDWAPIRQLVMPMSKNDIIDEIQDVTEQKNIVAMPGDVPAVFASTCMDDLVQLGHFCMTSAAWSCCTQPKTRSPSICINAMMAWPPIARESFQFIDP